MKEGAGQTHRQQLHDSGAINHYCQWSPGTDNLLADQVFAGGVYDGTLWAATDHLGTVQELVDDTAAVVEHREYDSFGAIDAVYGTMLDMQVVRRPLGELLGRGRGPVQQACPLVRTPRWGRFLGEDPSGLADGPNPSCTKRLPTLRTVACIGFTLTNLASALPAYVSVVAWGPAEIAKS